MKYQQGHARGYGPPVIHMKLSNSHAAAVVIMVTGKTCLVFD